MMTNEQKHRKMWTWIAETGNQKDDYFRIGPGAAEKEQPIFQCYACKEAMERRGGEKMDFCTFCPVV